MSETISGGCYCGKIKFEAHPPILYQAYCHCDNCRKAIGAQVVAWITVEISNFRYIQGTPKTYQTETKATRSFCQECGSSLTYNHPDRPTHVDIVTGSLDHPENFPPDHDIYPEEKLPWIKLCNPQP